jgi:hypothetical protein
VTPERLAEVEEALSRRSCRCPECELARELLGAVKERLTGGVGPAQGANGRA